MRTGRFLARLLSGRYRDKKCRERGHEVSLDMRAGEAALQMYLVSIQRNWDNRKAQVKKTKQNTPALV